jgi:2-dehydro-3-deoxyphosphogluconate aldolase/(4S)-4-hydroxy-2-oxoglutarate aldolase
MNPIDIASHGPVIPVIVIDRVEDALPLAEALLAGGVKVLEVTLRTAAGLPAIEAIARNLPEAVVGVGTVLNADDARRASEAGARFAVSPGYTSEVGGACKDLNLPLLPGVATSSEIMAALADGFSFLKLFPAEAAGGIPLLKAWASPFGQVSFCPTGGISQVPAPNDLAVPNVRCVGGSWWTPADAMRQGDWARITQLARDTHALRAPV